MEENRRVKNVEVTCRANWRAACVGVRPDEVSCPSSTTAVEGVDLQNERGQSIVEFALSLPLLLGLILVLIKINTAIQMSIVNQQHARAQALVLTYNSPVYPELKRRYARFQNLDKDLTTNHMVVGVSDNVSTSGDYAPRASVQVISRQPRPDEGPIQSEPSDRKRVRIRSSVTICTQSNVKPDGRAFLGSEETSKWDLPEESRYFDYCGGKTRFDRERGASG